MSVSRISKQGLRKILKDNSVEDTSCIVKFYSNDCPFCVRLKDEYHTLSDSYDKVHFFVVNIDDAGGLDDLVNINGVPSIAFVNIVNARRKVIMLEDPQVPDEVTWFHPLDIKQFIEGCIND